MKSEECVIKTKLYRSSEYGFGRKLHWTYGPIQVGNNVMFSEMQYEPFTSEECKWFQQSVLPRICLNSLESPQRKCGEIMSIKTNSCDLYSISTHM